MTLWPLAIEEARLTAAPPDMPALHRYLPANIHVAGALRITLRTFGELTFSQLAGLNKLPFYLCGEERTASHLFELLHTSAIASLAGIPGHFDGALDVNLKQPVMYEGTDRIRDCCRWRGMCFTAITCYMNILPVRNASFFHPDRPVCRVTEN